ncbi:hypothetical protein PG997_000336 [Apiospora hydei]|uniref:Uncharacterized protein n=1 Tax=Apiospora hydei TaxID=1337664 RepID=A0ABR1XAA9_9PEZI
MEAQSVYSDAGKEAHVEHGLNKRRPGQGGIEAAAFPKKHTTQPARKWYTAISNSNERIGMWARSPTTAAVNKVVKRSA